MKGRRQASGVRRKDKRDPEEKYVAAIAPDVLKYLRKIGYFAHLDDILASNSGKANPCRHDYRYSKRLLIDAQLKKSDWADVFLVLQSRGGFCDCEVLYNAATRSRLKSKYWKARYTELTNKPLP